jgi:hypothetical protein
MSRVLDDVDIDIAAFEWVYTSTSIYRILILVNLDDIVEFVWAILVSTKVIKIEPVRLAALAGDDSPARKRTS